MASNSSDEKPGNAPPGNVTPGKGNPSHAAADDTDDAGDTETGLSLSWMDGFAELDLRLRAQGIVCSADCWVNVGDLLMSLLADGSLPKDQASVSRYLAPLFCQSPSDQRIFEAVFSAWWSNQSQQIKPDAQGALPKEQEEGQKDALKTQDKKTQPRAATKAQRRTILLTRL